MDGSNLTDSWRAFFPAVSTARYRDTLRDRDKIALNRK